MSFIHINHYYDSIVPGGSSWIDKTVPTVVGVLIGFGLNRLYDNYKERKEITNSGEDFLNEVNLLSEPINNQLTSLDKMIEQMEAKELTTPNVTINIAFVAERFNSIDRLKVFKYIQRSKKQDGRKIVNHLYALIKRIELDAARIEKYLNEYLETSQESFNIFYQATNRMLRDFSEIMAEVEKKDIKLSDDPLMVDALPLLKRFSDNQDMNLVQLTEYVCYPLLEMTAKHRTDDRTKVISKQNAICFDSFKSTIEAKRVFGDRLKQIKESLSKINSELATKLIEAA